MYFRPYLVALSLAVATLSSPVKRGATTVESDIINIDTQMKSLDASIIAFLNSGDAFEALAIAHAAITLDNDIRSATNDANASAALTEAQGSTIVGGLKTLVLDTQQTLSDLAQGEGAVAGLPFTDAISLVKQELETLKSDYGALLADLLTKIPAGLVSDVKADQTLVNAAFSKAIAAYSS